ncbi:MAG TPA: LysR substrate-binding domain-containing protein [Terracidiphilus sp.]|nr:LysR substrate-binding domain-containing protein [Terracidiphilus sp.]
MASLENFRLVVFRAVAEHLSFRRAAEELYLTQPAVSLQVKALEDDLGVQLFDRTGSHVTLTAAGEVLLRHARASHAVLLEAEAEIAAAVGEHAGHLALGASTTIAQYVLPRLLGEFRRLHPRISLRLLSGNTEHIVHALEEGKIALGLIEGPARSRDVKTEPFLLDDLVLIVPSSHEWGDAHSVPARSIQQTPLLMREHGSGSRHVVEEALEKHGIRRSALNFAMDLDSTEAIKSAVEAGLGVGFVSQCALAQDARLGAAIRVVQVEGLRMQRKFLIASLAGPQPQGPASEFRRFLLARTAAVSRESGAPRQTRPRTDPRAARKSDKKSK